MPDILIKGFSDEEGKQLTTLASQEGQDRMAWIHDVLIDLLTGKRLIIPVNEQEREALLHSGSQEPGTVLHDLLFDLEAYRELLKLHLPTFSQKEALFLADIWNGSKRMEPERADTLWMEVDDMVSTGWARYWGIDGDALVKRFQALGEQNPFACWAVREAVRRAWNTPEYAGIPIGKRLLDVGLVREEDPDAVD